MGEARLALRAKMIATTTNNNGLGAQQFRVSDERLIKVTASAAKRVVFSMESPDK